MCAYDCTYARLNKRQERWTLNSTNQRILKRNNIPMFFETSYKQHCDPQFFGFLFVLICKVENWIRKS